ncbi:HET-domain-containing protein [Aspergillus campestris IBT 28561]|uniref:HET-domain-containing protein n=1 Tax=Aspergillus campestris (strain IBT 28561) TaxID=1392248 RepID=A0A2I1D450_ASPC2|nr:HET-domain-containing protein [Aspergillus campestris IBT 28561]PKY04661.1 HET-domain-containing protein [Aspergillus campestris IBT 28561]
MPIDSKGCGMLCEACQKIFRGQQILSTFSTTSDDQSTDWNPQAHHPSLQSFVNASDSGCPVCYEFRSSIGESRLEILLGFSTSNEFSYWTLNHREGGGYELSLHLDEDYDKLIEECLGLDLEVLPLQKAITVCRRFSISYLWIDSLCIIQDSVADWRAEAASMEGVYGNSRLNIMATASRNSHEGLFRSRDPRHLGLCIFESEWTDAENDRFSIVQGEMWQMEITDAPLNQRGWVLQERILPPRALHYGQKQLLWECRELDACEKYPTGLPKVLRNILTGVKITDPVAYRLYEHGWKSRERDSVDKEKCLETVIDFAYKLWSRWIYTYSSMRFTRYSDRLIAFSGLASRMRAILRDEYVAGLWRSRLIDELLWFTFGHGSIEYELRPYRPLDGGAPSWSWASLTGEIITNTASVNSSKVYHLDLKAVNVTPVSGREGGDNSNHTGAILDGQVRIKGFLKRVTLLKSVYHMPEADYEAPSTSYSIKVDGIEPFNTYVDEPMANRDTMGIVVLPVLTTLTDSDSDSKNKELHALLLRRPAGLPRGFYARVGYVSGSEKKFSGSQLGDFFGNYQTATSAQGKGGSGTGFRNTLRKLVRAKEPCGSGDSWPKLGDKKLYLPGAYGEFILV